MVPKGRSTELKALNCGKVGGETHTLSTLHSTFSNETSFCPPVFLSLPTPSFLFLRRLNEEVTKKQILGGMFIVY